MTGIERFSSGGPWEPVVGYSRAVRAGDHVHVSGCTGVGSDGRPVAGGAEAQMTQALANLATALGLAGATLGQVVRTRMFVVDIAANADAAGRAHGAVFGAILPAASMIGVSALIDPALLVEIEADAYSPGRDPSVWFRARGYPRVMYIGLGTLLLIIIILVILF